MSSRAYVVATSDWSLVESTTSYPEGENLAVTPGEWEQLSAEERKVLLDECATRTAVAGPSVLKCNLACQVPSCLHEAAFVRLFAKASGEVCSLHLYTSCVSVAAEDHPLASFISCETNVVDVHTAKFASHKHKV